MQSFESLQPQDFNLEGVIYTEKMVFIQSVTGVVAKIILPFMHKKPIKSLA
jgi:hypothetical protein